MRTMPPVLAGIGHGEGHMGDWGGAWMWLFGVVVMTILVVLVVWVVRSTVVRPPGREPDPMDRAREVLAERYARGELSTEEYRERRRELGGA